MSRVILYALLTLVCLGVVYGGWRIVVSSDVAFIKATIQLHNTRLKESNPHMVLRADSVIARGFPFSRHVVAKQLSLSMIQGQETYMLRFPELVFKRRGDGYEVVLPPELEALYAEGGKSPEVFFVKPEGIEGIRLLKEPEVLEAYALKLSRLMFHVTYAGDEQTIRFDMVPPRLEGKIPANLERELWMAIAVLREAMVFKTPHH